MHKISETETRKGKLLINPPTELKLKVRKCKQVRDLFKYFVKENVPFNSCEKNTNLRGLGIKEK